MNDKITEKYLEEIAAGLLLHNKQGGAKLSWADTYKVMSAEYEDWSDLDTVAGDGVGAKNFSPLRLLHDMYGCSHRKK